MAPPKSRYTASEYCQGDSRPPDRPLLCGLLVLVMAAGTCPHAGLRPPPLLLTLGCPTQGAPQL